MQTIDLATEQRADTGGRASRKLRREGRLPVNLYGRKEEAKSFSIDAKGFMDALRHHARVFTLETGSGSVPAVVHELQYDPISQQVIHADFLRVDLSERVSVVVPLKVQGPSKGEAEGGILQEHQSEVHLRCLPLEIPEEIVVDVRELVIGDVLHVSDLVLPDGVESTDDPTYTVLTISEPRYADTALDEGGTGEDGAEPGADGEAADGGDGESKPEDDGGS